MLKVADKAAQVYDLRLIAPERPGYGLSQPSRNASLLGYTEIVSQLADLLGLDHFAVMGISGGGPFALACAYQMPYRLTSATVVSGIGLLHSLNNLRGMLPANRMIFTLGRFSPALVGFLVPRLLRSSLPSMEKQVQDNASPTPDLSPEEFALVTADQREAIRTGGKGVVHDLKALWRNWGFRLQDIRTPVFLWHGEADNLAPAALAHSTAQRIPGCEATFYPGEGHTGPLTKHMNEILSKVG
jgi:pimeloyl-ACP methyl ester carboxylesterase